MNNRNHKSGRKPGGDGVLHIAVADDEEEFRRRIGVFSGEVSRLKEDRI